MPAAPRLFISFLHQVTRASSARQQAEDSAGPPGSAPQASHPLARVRGVGPGRGERNCIAKPALPSLAVGGAGRLAAHLFSLCQAFSLFWQPKKREKAVSPCPLQPALPDCAPAPPEYSSPSPLALPHRVSAVPAGLSPELQPAEHLWLLTNTALANRHFATIEDLEEVQAARCVALQGRPDLIRSTTRFHWWPQRIRKRQGPRRN
jgi:hypothetical protein